MQRSVETHLNSSCLQVASSVTRQTILSVQSYSKQTVIQDEYKCSDLPLQFSSSSPSSQSLSWSHTQRCVMQWLDLLHMNMLGGHVAATHDCSSSPSLQSCCLSHFQERGIHSPPVPHWNWSSLHRLLAIDTKVMFHQNQRSKFNYSMVHTHLFFEKIVVHVALVEPSKKMRS